MRPVSAPAFFLAGFRFSAPLGIVDAFLAIKTAFPKPLAFIRLLAPLGSHDAYGAESSILHKATEWGAHYSFLVPTKIPWAWDCLSIQAAVDVPLGGALGLGRRAWRQALAFGAAKMGNAVGIMGAFLAPNPVATICQGGHHSQEKINQYSHLSSVFSFYHKRKHQI
jgi:hypothetical protein